MADDLRRILVVDHDDGGRVLMSSILEGAGFATAGADTGESALAAARSTLPRLALVDIYLPGLSGYEVCHRLKMECGDSFPVVLVSRSEREALDCVAAVLLEADGCVAKPIRPDDLLHAVHRLLGRPPAADAAA